MLTSQHESETQAVGWIFTTVIQTVEQDPGTMDADRDFDETTSEELHNITLISYQNILELSPVLKELAVSAKHYLKSLQNVRQAAGVFHDSLAKVSQMALQSKGAATNLGDAISNMVAVKREMETRHGEVIKYLQNDLISPLEKLAETDVVLVKTCQKTYNQDNKSKVELVEKAKGELLKIRKKSQRKKPTEKYEEKEKQYEEQVEMYQQQLQEFRTFNCKKAVSEERKRYCFVLDRTSIVAKSTMEYSEHNAQILRERLPVWFSLVKKKGEPNSQVNGSVLPNMSNSGQFEDSNDRVKLRAIFSHSAVESSQLSFKEGDLIHPISEVVSGWQYGENVRSSKSGWFPAAYTEHVLAVPTGPSVSHTLPAGGIHPRPALDPNDVHKSLKRYSSTGPQSVSLPPPDYPGGVEETETNEPSTGDTPSTPLTTQSPGETSTTTTPTAANSPMVPPAPPPPPPPPMMIPEKDDMDVVKVDGTEAVNTEVNIPSSPDVSRL